MSLGLAAVGATAAAAGAGAAVVRAVAGTRLRTSQATPIATACRQVASKNGAPGNWMGAESLMAS